MSRASTGNGLTDTVFGNSRLFCVHFIDYDLIEAKVWDEGIFAIRRKSGPVGMGRFLPFGDDFGSTLMFRDGGFP
jgi:hypothetical protein